jgi:hypothetical protein
VNVRKEAEMANREDGFYWILFQREWQVAEFNTSVTAKWYVVGSEETISESHIDEIDERRIYREPPSYDMKCSCGRTLHQHTYCQICDNDE